MADINVKIKGDDSDLKAKFRESSAEAQAFSKEVQKSLEAISEASKNVVSETGLGGIGKMLGTAGLAGAAVEFSSFLVKGFKDAIGAALDFGKQVSQLRSALGVALGGQAEEWAERIRTVSGAMGDFSDNMSVFKGLVRGGLMPEEALRTLIDLQNAAKVTGYNFGELGEKFAEIKQRPEEMGRFFRSFPALEPIARAMGGGENPSVDFMFKRLLPNIAPGGLTAPIRMGAEGSVRGQFMAMQEELNKQWAELGKDLLPAVNASLREMKSHMPEITGAMKTLGEELQKDIPKVVGFMKTFFGTGERIEHPTTAFGQGLKSVNDYFDKVQDNIWNLFFKPSQFLQEAAAQQKEAAENLRRITHPKGG